MKIVIKIKLLAAQEQNKDPINRTIGLTGILISYL